MALGACSQPEPGHLIAPGLGRDGGYSDPAPFDGGTIVPSGTNAGVHRIWVDRNGLAVGESPEYTDSAGRHWTLDLETGQPTPTISTYPFFMDGGCSTPEYVVAMSPRQPFALVGDSALRVRPDTLQSVLMDAGSLYVRTAVGDCVTYPSTLRVVALSAMIPVLTTPALPYAPPLRREAR